MLLDQRQSFFFFVNIPFAIARILDVRVRVRGLFSFTRTSRPARDRICIRPLDQRLWPGKSISPRRSRPAFAHSSPAPHSSGEVPATPPMSATPRVSFGVAETASPPGHAPAPASPQTRLHAEPATIHLCPRAIRLYRFESLGRNSQSGQNVAFSI